MEFKLSWFLLICVFVLLRISAGLYQNDDTAFNHDAIGTIHYTRQELLNIGTSLSSQVSPDLVLPEHCRKRNYRRRGKRSGARVKSRMRLKKNKPYVPSVIFGNVRSVANKIEELRLDCKYLHEYRESCIIGITETWLGDYITDSAVEIDGFNLVRCDRTKESGKSRGGGVALYISEKWCKNITIKKQLCSRDIELMCLSLRPYYLPREISNIFVCILYIPPSANYETAKQTVRDYITSLTNEKPDALNIIMGDINQCELNQTLSYHGFEQCVTCKTRGTVMLDTFYCNIKQAYRCKQLPPLKNSDHNMISMMPVYCPKLKKSKPTVISKTIIDETTISTLNGCFDLTDWRGLGP